MDTIWVTDDNHNMYELPTDIFNFSPIIDDNIRILSKGEKQIATQVKKDTNAPTNAAPSINIVNTSTNTNTNTNLNTAYLSGGGYQRINKYLYIALTCVLCQYFLKHGIIKSIIYLATWGYFGIGLVIEIIQIVVHFNSDPDYYYFTTNGHWA